MLSVVTDIGSLLLLNNNTMLTDKLANFKLSLLKSQV